MAADSEVEYIAARLAEALSDAGKLPAGLRVISFPERWGKGKRDFRLAADLGGDTHVYDVTLIVTGPVDSP